MILIWRKHIRDTDGESRGFTFHTSRLEAIKDSGDAAGIDVLEIDPSKAGIILALNRYAAHPDNG